MVRQEAVHSGVRQPVAPHRHHQLAAFLIALVLLQHIEMSVCRNADINGKRLSAESTGLPFTGNGPASSLPLKRTPVSENGGPSQKEEIFSVADQMDSNYNEYPMIVPKRAAVLLDRLMIALHHALEKQRSARINEFYANRYAALKDHKPVDTNEEEDRSDQGLHYSMYSDDDPNVAMDYDFKDLNSYNRATGETLMAKSFQRRASNFDGFDGDVGDVGDGDVDDDGRVSGGRGGRGNRGQDGSFKSKSLSRFKTTEDAGNFGGGVGVRDAALAASSRRGSGGGGGGGFGGRRTVGPGGRLYWRCYFNAISCFRK